MMLTAEQVHEFQQVGHLTVADVLERAAVESLLADVETWGDEFMSEIGDDDRSWYVEKAGGEETSVLRKLDNPVFHRPAFEDIARSPTIFGIVERLIGPDVSVFFSQVFCKPPEIGGPKPVHQDNFYFGPSEIDATLTLWIALDEATIENGCLYYADSSNAGPIYPHLAPDGEPFNLQIAPEFLSKHEMTAAPVPAGGISLHHGNTWHQSSSNASSKPRRAAAFHFLRNDAELVHPALEYDPVLNVDLTKRL